MTGPARRFALLGHPVGHSLSPALHAAALRATGLTGGYVLIDVLAADLAEQVARLRRGELDGLNVTVPHKLAVAALCDRLAPSAERLGAVNTLVLAPGREVVGHNSDLPGLVAAVRAAWPDAALRGRPACVVGAGGAARAAVCAAAELGASEVRVLNRTRARAAALVAALAPSCPVPLAVAGDPRAGLTGAALVLQAASVGMGTTPGDAAWTEARAAATAALAHAPADAALMDLVYRPPETPWLAAARARGLRAEHGLAMLAHQAALAFALWTGLTPPVAELLAAAGAASAGAAPE